MQRQLHTQEISSRRTHHNIQASATLNRRYVRRPVSNLTKSTSSQSTISHTNTQSYTPAQKQSSIQTSPNDNSINITFKHKTPAKPLAKKTISIPVSKTPVTSTPEPKKITVLDDTSVATNTRQATPTARIASSTAPIFNQQAKIDHAFALVSRQEQETLNQAIRPAAIFTNSYKFKAPAKTLAEIEQSIAKPLKKPKPLDKKTQVPSKIPASNMTVSSVESAFKRIQKPDQKNTITTKASVQTPLKTTSSLAKHHKKGARIFFAFLCSSAVVAALFFVVQSNMPDISVKVAAMQTGIQATYPNYIPRDYRLSGVYTAQDNSVAMDFVGPNQAKFTLTEEKLPWDSTTLLNRFVKQKWGENYDSIREQGITIYINGSNATWVNAGIVYKIINHQGELSKKQIKNIVTSL
ncbi:MAG: hypothetical protein ACFN3A_01365 [Candidatus Nanosyncoccus sp.]